MAAAGINIGEIAARKFDYIIVGGGTAGLTLAARLTEDPSTQVLVLEAGADSLDLPDLQRPWGWLLLMANPEYAWPHKVTKHAKTGDRDIFWHRGKGLGGSSGINGFLYVRPPKRDIDDIARLGNPGWDWASMTKYFKRAEGFVDPSREVAARAGVKCDTWDIGREGPVKITFPKIDDAEIKCQQAFLNAGAPAAPDPIGGNPNGVFFCPSTLDPVTRLRSYAKTAYYEPNKHRTNLVVLIGAAVGRVLFSRSDDRGDYTAAGVEFGYDGRPYTASARREVVLSAGTLHTPQLLELSGIGRKDVLQKLDVPVKVDLPGVGENLQEHIIGRVVFELKDGVQYDTTDLLQIPGEREKQIELHKQGLGVFSNSLTGMAFLTLDTVTPKAAELYESMQAMVAGLDQRALPPGLLEQHEIMLERFKPGSGSPGCESFTVPGWGRVAKPSVPGRKYISVFPAVNYMFSRGRVHAVSRDAAVPPEIDARYFERDVDLDVFVEQVKFVRKVAATSPLKDIIAQEHTPGPEVQTDEQIKDWLRTTFITTWHTAGSCSMLPRDKGGVVDPDLKVYGTTNLRVVDLSVIPLHFAAHPQSMVYALAEKAADIIKDSYRV